MPYSKQSFGRDILGPILAEFMLRLWIYLSSLERQDETVLMFCARGGLRLQFLYARFLAASGLKSPVHADNLMVSRVVAVRPALLRSAGSAFEQIEYEFRDASLNQATKAISGIDLIGIGGPREMLSRPFKPAALAVLLRSEAGRPALDGLRAEADRFRRHLHSRAAGRSRIVLCDTGLFGSTIQLLQDGVPDLSWTSCLFARANYKRLPAPHFARTIGLCVEADQYSPLRPRTAALRNWQLIESVLEPDLPSAYRFDEVGGALRSNLEIDDWQSRVAPVPGTIFAGVAAYIDALPSLAACGRIIRDAAPAWAALHRTIVWPRRDEAEVLDPGCRSDDFGRERIVSNPAAHPGLLWAMRASLWREGRVARAGTRLRPLLLLGIETACSARWCWRCARAMVAD